MGGNLRIIPRARIEDIDGIAGRPGAILEHPFVTTPEIATALLDAFGTRCLTVLDLQTEDDDASSNL